MDARELRCPFMAGCRGARLPQARSDRQRVESIESKSVEEEPMVLECRIRGYDRDAAVGKLSSEHFVRVLIGRDAASFR